MDNVYTEISKVLITGTKGKTSVATIIGDVITNLGKDTVLVNSTGAYFNDRQFSKVGQSRFYGYTHSAAPARFIVPATLKENIKPRDSYAILEADIECFRFGTGFEHFHTGHDVGIFTNIYEDHIDGKLIKNRDDIYTWKSFIFQKLNSGGTLICSLDNDLTVNAFKEPILQKKQITRIGVSTKISDQAELLKLQKQYQLADIVFISGNFLIQSLSTKINYDPSGFSYYFQGRNPVMTENLTFVLAYFLDQFPTQLSQVYKQLNKFKFPASYGRFAVFTKGNQRIILDEAHEQKSITNLIEFVNTQYNQQPYLVIRVAPNRTNEYIEKYTKIISLLNVSGITIYDTIDGIHKKHYHRGPYTRKVGETAQLAIVQLKKTKPTKIIINESDALLEAIKVGHKLIVHIVKYSDDTLVSLAKEGFKQVL